MADEINATSTTDNLVPTAAVKKTRGPNKSKAAVDVVAISAPAKKTRVSKKSSAKENRTASAPAQVEKAPTKTAIAKPEKATRGPRKAQAAISSTDGFADLMSLEEENQKLRKALAEKLRAENADLRKKLGRA
jgi:putative transposase